MIRFFNASTNTTFPSICGARKFKRICTFNGMESRNVASVFWWWRIYIEFPSNSSLGKDVTLKFGTSTQWFGSNLAFESIFFLHTFHSTVYSNGEYIDGAHMLQRQRHHHPHICQVLFVAKVLACRAFNVQWYIRKRGNATRKTVVMWMA